MAFEAYLREAQTALARVEHVAAHAIREAGSVLADALAAGGVIHVFGCGHSHMLAEEVFYRAGGLVAVNPILDPLLMFLEGALASSRAENEAGLAARLLERELVAAHDAAIVISNSGRNVTPVEMALALKSRGPRVVAITSLSHARAVAARHPSGKKLHEIADIVIDTGVPAGDAAVEVPGSRLRMGPLSTVVGAAIMQALMIEAAARLVARGHEPHVLTSANLDTTSEERQRQMLARYADRVRYYDLPHQSG